MKFYCDNCQAKYSIADEKVRGKVLKVRCKKCSFVITVREPRAPVAQQARRASQSDAIPWYYALNGQTFGPYEESALMRMFESGEIDDACYIWNESFTEWLPARQVASFVPALNHGAKIRPRHKTIGVSGALEAIKIDQIEPGALQQLQQPQGEDDPSEEAGVVPGQMADRIDALRERLKQHNRTPESGTADPTSPHEAAEPAKLSVSLVEKKPAGARFAKQADQDDSTTQMSVAEISGLLERPGALESVSPDTDALEFLDDVNLEMDEHLIDEPSEAEGGESLMDSLFPDESADIGPAFMGGPSSQDSVIDFSRLEKKDDEQTSHDGLFAGSASNFAPPAGAGPEQFQTSNSLLIQMDSIKKQGRSKRVMLIGGLVLVFSALGVVAVIASQNAEKTPDKNLGSNVYDGSKKELVMKRYSEEERALYEMPGEEVISADGPDVEEAPEDNPEVPVIKPTVVAKNDPRPPKTTGPNLRGIDALISEKGSSQDDALNSSTSKKRQDTGSGLGTTSDGSAKAVVGSTLDPSKKAFVAPPSLGGTTGPRISTITPKTTPGREEKADSPRLGDAGTLSPQDAKAGFKKVSRSVQTCHQRQVSRGLPLDAPKVHVTLEIKGDGSVSNVLLEPASILSSEFASCLESHRRGGRWPFAEFGGKTLKIRHTYVLQ